MNMAQRHQRPTLEAYRPMLLKWMPTAELRVAPAPLAPFDAVITFKAGGKAIRYLAEEKRHLRHQDVAAVVEQLKRLQATLPHAHAGARALFLAPHVRAQQAAVLERAGIDYIDLAGNAHLQAPGLLVHVEGRQPPKAPARLLGRPQKGWIKAVMALLVQPELITAPYRALADQADVALGTVAGCMRDLVMRGLVLEAKGERRVADRNGLVALWVQAYVEGLRPKLPERRLQMRDRQGRDLGEGGSRARRTPAAVGADGRRCGRASYAFPACGRNRDLRAPPHVRRRRPPEGARRSTDDQRGEPPGH